MLLAHAMGLAAESYDSGTIPRNATMLYLGSDIDVDVLRYLLPTERHAVYVEKFEDGDDHIGRDEWTRNTYGEYGRVARFYGEKRPSYIRDSRHLRPWTGSAFQQHELASVILGRLNESGFAHSPRLLYQLRDESAFEFVMNGTARKLYFMSCSAVDFTNFAAYNEMDGNNLYPPDSVPRAWMRKYGKTLVSRLPPTLRMFVGRVSTVAMPGFGATSNHQLSVLFWNLVAPCLTHFRFIASSTDQYKNDIHKFFGRPFASRRGRPYLSLSGTGVHELICLRNRRWAPSTVNFTASAANQTQVQAWPRYAKSTGRRRGAPQCYELGVSM